MRDVLGTVVASSRGARTANSTELTRRNRVALRVRRPNGIRFEATSLATYGFSPRSTAVTPMRPIDKAAVRRPQPSGPAARVAATMPTKYSALTTSWPPRNPVRREAVLARSMP